MARHNFIVSIGFAAFMAALMVPSPTAVAATKVPTKTIIVPEEAPEQSQDNTGKIPEDAVPNLDPNSVETDGTNSEIAPSTETPSSDTEEPSSAEDKRPPPPPVIRDISKLPEPVRRMRQLILEAAKKGDIEGLRPLIGLGESATNLSIGGVDGDPIAYLKETSGDDEGYEILAILIEVLEAGFVQMDAGTEEELFVWPYFFAWPLEGLNKAQNVELFRILTAGDVQDSNEFGGYIFYRVGIKPDGSWSFFVAGD